MLPIGGLLEALRDDISNYVPPDDEVYTKKYTNINEIFYGKKRLVDDFTDADLSSIDLSGISPKLWYGTTFYHTNFENTGIKFYPRDLLKKRIYFGDGTSSNYFRDMRGCNFRGCDLSYLKDDDLIEVLIAGCNFKDTNLLLDFRYLADYYQSIQISNPGRFLLKGVALPQSYNNKDISYFDDIYLDFNFLEKNKHIKVSSGKLLEIIKDTLPKINYSPSSLVLLSEELEEQEFQQKRKFVLKIIDEYDKEGLLKRLYYSLRPSFIDTFFEEQFFDGIINGLYFDVLDLSYLTPKLLFQLNISQCDINKLILPIGFKELNEFSDKYREEFSSAKLFDDVNFKIVQLPITPHNWDNRKETRVIGTSITYQTDIYVELKRICNMKCTFCRNDGLDNQEYYYQKMVKNLKIIYPHLNHIVVGGGEPTLLKNHLFNLKPDVLGYVHEFYNNWYFITNGTLPVEEYKKLSSRYHIYLSRHAIDDKENRAIFNDKNNSILSENELYDLKREVYGDVILCCTCFKGGVDSVFKILSYIKFAQELDYNNILFQTLDQEDNFSKEIGQVDTIDEDVFKTVLSSLELDSFKISKPIYSTSRYELHSAILDNLKIHFKEYKNPKYIEQQWYQSPKRCFDLSMAPNGDVYETWSQQKGPIKLKK